MAEPTARQGFAIVTRPSKLGVSFTRYLLKNTSLPVVVTGGNEKTKSKNWLLEELSDVEEVASRLHYIYGSPSRGNTTDYLRLYLKNNFPRQPLRLMVALPGNSDPSREEFKLNQVTYESILGRYQRSVISHELLMKGFHGFLLKHDAEPFPVSETDKCKLPAHSIWALPLGRSASISQNTAGAWLTHQATSAATLQLTKGFDNFLRWRSQENAISMAFHVGKSKIELENPHLSAEDVFSRDEMVEKIMKVLTTLPPDQARGRCWDDNHEEVVP